MSYITRRFSVALSVLVLFIGCSTTSTVNEVSDGYVRVNGVEHYYKIVGSGEPFVVLHGGPGMYHDELYPYFADFALGHQLIFYDQRGNGKSSMEKITAENFNTDVLTDDLEGLRLALGYDQWSVIGHSWGGLLAMHYAARYPERVSRLITVSAAPVTTELLIASYEKHISRFAPEQWQYLQSLWESDAFQNGDPNTHNEAMRLNEGATFYDKSYIEDYMAVAAFNETTANNTVALAKLATAMKLNINIKKELVNITAPTLLVHGRDDFIVEEAAVLAQRLIPNSELVWIEKCGHYPHVERREEFFDIVTEFVASTPMR